MWNPQGWNTQVIAALVAAFVALTVALLQAITHRKNSQSIESLKARLDHERELRSEYLRRYLEFLIEGKERELQAFKEMLQYVQAMRDKVRSVIKNPTSYDLQTLKDEIRKSSTEVVESFARNQAHFAEEDCKLAHTLKNKSKEMADQLLTSIREWERCRKFSVPQEIHDKQEELTNLQIRFRERAFGATKIFTESLMEQITPREHHG